MEPQEFRFRGGRIALEAWLAGVAWLVLAFSAPELLPRDAESRMLRTVLVASLPLPLVLLAVLRWGSRIRIDRDGIERRRSRKKVLMRIEWDEVEELFLLGRDGFEVRGAGKAIRIAAYHANAWRARELSSEQLGGLRDRLRNRALRDAELVFRMPGSPWKAHLSYLLAILILTGLTGLILAPFLLKRRMGFPFFIILFGGSWLWNLRRRASRLGTRVSLYKDGLLVRRLDGRDRIAWSEIAATEWDAQGGLILVLGSGRRIPLPPSLSNIALLEEFVEEGREAASARS